MRKQSGTMPVWAQSQGAIESSQAVGLRPRSGGSPEHQRGWLNEPKAAVWIALGLVVLIGGARKLLELWRARRAVALLDSTKVTAEQIEAVAEHGRTGAHALLRVFSTSESEVVRHAAGRALARLWLDDQLIAEEEQAVLRRGYTVNWNARRRYPRALQTEIPIEVAYEVPFLEDDGRRVGPSSLEWSHRIVGARRASLEELSPWIAGRGHASFTIVPSDFETNGPHRLVLHTRVRTKGLSDSWEIELPQIPFNFEFDPMLRLDAILALTDAARDETIAQAIRLEPATLVEGEPIRYITIGGDWALRNPPRLAVATPLPCDLAHTIALEIEGVPGELAAGRVVLSGQGASRRDLITAHTAIRRFDLGVIATVPPTLIERPGLRRIRLSLVADPALGWADPHVRSLWPGHTKTNWAEVEIVRR